MKRGTDVLVSYQFLAWARLHVIGVRIRILQRVATLRKKEKRKTKDDTFIKEEYVKKHSLNIIKAS